jgi:rhodanese-related sulfurtransferase
MIFLEITTNFMQQPITKQQIEELQQQSGTVTLIDIRPAEEYKKMHVPGSVNMPAETIAENITKFTPDEAIVCICTKGLERSQNAAATIAEMGYTNVFYLENGTLGWLAE